MSLRRQLIRLAYTNRELRPHLLPLLVKRAGVARWSKVSLQLPDPVEGVVNETTGYSLGAWAVHKSLTGKGWGVSHIPSGASAGTFGSQKVGRLFVEAMFAEVPELAKARTIAEIKPHFRVLSQLSRGNPRTWPTLDSPVDVSGDFSLDPSFLPKPKPKQKARKVKLPARYVKLLQRATQYGIVPGGIEAPERTTYKAIDDGLLESSPENVRVYRISEKGRQALKDGFFIREPK